MLVVLFGKIGVGKSYVGKILENDFGYLLHEGDRDLPEDMKIALVNEEKVTDKMRNYFFQNISSSIRKLKKKHENIVLTQTFIKEKFRKEFITEFPESLFVLIETDYLVRKRRLSERNEFNFTKEYIERMDLMFEEPKTKLLVIIDNNEEGLDSVKKQLTEILKV